MEPAAAGDAVMDLWLYIGFVAVFCWQQWQIGGLHARIRAHRELLAQLLAGANQPGASGTSLSNTRYVPCPRKREPRQ